MGNLADFIEQHLRRMLEEDKIIELQRCDLAKMFRCAPSQINYVLETRFTLDRGYLIESKRGGGGYIRISQIEWRAGQNLPRIIEQAVPERLSVAGTERLLAELTIQGLVNPAEAHLLLQAATDHFAELPPEAADYLRARLVKALLLVLGTRIETHH